MANTSNENPLSDLELLSHLRDGERVVLIEPDTQRLLSHLRDGEHVTTTDALIAELLSHLRDGEHGTLRL